MVKLRWSLWSPICAVALLSASGVQCAAQDREGVRLTVRFVADRGGQALEGVVFGLSGIGERFVTDGEGRATFHAPVGSYLLIAHKTGYQPLEGDFEVRRPGSITLRMTRSAPGESVPGRLHGTVLDERSRRPIEGAEVRSGGVGSAITDGEGRFSLDPVSPGVAELTVRMLGYAERSEPVLVQPGQTTVVRIGIAVDPIELDPIDVEVRSRFLEMRGVYRRMERGVSTRTVTRDQIELNPSPRLSDSLDGMGGVHLVRMNKRAVLLGRGRCQLRVYLDGVRMRPDIEGSVDIDQVPPDWVEIVEVYAGIASVPAEYAEVGQDCGVALIWTRQRAR